VKGTILGILAFAILAFAPPAAADDLGGWQEAKWGMTPGEVQKALSHPTRAADLAKVCGEKCNEGAALELDDYQLDAQHFVVRLWFTKVEMRLQDVSMYAKQLDDTNGNEAFTKIKSLLESLYGKPASVHLRRGEFNISWSLPLTTVTLYSNAMNYMTIIYEERSNEPGKS
jgi:hypothetical protein